MVQSGTGKRSRPGVRVCLRAGRGETLPPVKGRNAPIPDSPGEGAPVAAAALVDRTGPIPLVKKSKSLQLIEVR